MPHVAVVLNWQNEANKSGLYSVHIRVKIGAEAKYYKIELPRKVRESEWPGEEDGCGIEANDVKRLKDIEGEHAEFEKMYAEISMENRAMKNLMEKKNTRLINC